MTSPCEGVCALNHYCAITRVDYHEFRHCLESAASALASSSARPNVCIPIAANIALLLATYTIMKCQQRKLLFEWLQFLIVDLVIGLLLFVKYSRKLCVIMLDALFSSQWQNNGVNFQVKSSSMQMIYQENVNIHDNQAATETSTTLQLNEINFFNAFMNYAEMVMYQVCFLNARIFSCKECQLHNSTDLHTVDNVQKMILQMPQITSTTHQYSYQFSISNCKSCQTKLFTQVDSFKQMIKPTESVTDIDTIASHNV